uniref:Uncharacterized protein n=1 Tax=Glossina palpalis gambiensis TaxID=67801 RepID=A0A1B0B4Q4_9MUSC
MPNIRGGAYNDSTKTIIQPLSILTYLLDGGGQKRPTGLEMMMHFHPRSFSLKNTSPSSTRAIRTTTTTTTTKTTAYCMEGVCKLRHSKCHNWCGMKSSQAKNSNKNNDNDDYNDSQRQFTVEFSSVVCCQVVYNIQALPTELTIWLVLAADAVAAAAAAAVTVAALFCVLTLIACLVRCRINFATEIYKQEQTSQSCSIVVRNQSPNFLSGCVQNNLERSTFIYAHTQ